MNDKLSIQLIILSKITANDKLSTYNNKLSIDKYTLFQNVKRKFFGDSRINTIRFLNSLIDTCISFTNQIINSTFFNIHKIKDDETLSLYEKEQYNINYLQLKQYDIELRNSITGINNLCETYKEDIDTFAELQVIIRKIENQVVVIEDNLNKIN